MFDAFMVKKTAWNSQQTNEQTLKVCSKQFSEKPTYKFYSKFKFEIKILPSHQLLIKVILVTCYINICIIIVTVVILLKVH